MAGLLRRTIDCGAVFAVCVCILVIGAGCVTTEQGPEVYSNPRDLSDIPVNEWVSMFDGQTLKGWRVFTDEEFKSAGKAAVVDECIQLTGGMPFAAVIREGTFPKDNYEVELQAKRLKGNDIFCGLLFPVGDTYMSMVLGGWGNMVAGLSCVDDLNASENETGIDMSFDNDKWYTVLLRVANGRIQTFIDGKKIIDLERENRKLGPYPGLEEFAPFGAFAWETDAAHRDFIIRRVTKE